MQKTTLALGLDFGTESARALLVDARTGDELATATAAYPHGVIDRQLPSGVALEPDTALQHPGDYLAVLEQVVPAVLQQAGAKPEQIAGIGVDFTASTVLPTLADGTPLCRLDEFAGEPYAWVKLWKDHAAQPEAEAMNRLAAERDEPFLQRYGGRLSSEWLFPKALRMLRHAPRAFAAAERIIEAGDWLVWQLCGRERRSACQAGYKGLWARQGGHPSSDYLAALHTDFPRLLGKLGHRVFSLGNAAGGLMPAWAQRLGLRSGTPVSVAIIDAHAAVLGCGVAEAGKMVLVLGTSTCHLVMHPDAVYAPGIAGIVEDGIVPGLVAYESGQSAVGDIFAWFVQQQVPAALQREAEAQGMDIFAYLERLAAQVPPGANGVLALDWWNGNRSTLMDASLSGLLIGLTLATRPQEIYRALIEATAFGTLAIIDNHTGHGIPIDALYACGGLAERNRLLLQIYADVTGRPLRVAASAQATALGAAILGAVAAGKAGGGHADFVAATRAMARLQERVYTPDAATHRHYQRLYAEYVRLYDAFGRGMLDSMARLRALASG